MTSLYVAEHADALADLAEAGGSVTFSRTVDGTYDPATDTTTGASTRTITGNAARTAGNPDTYRALGLTQSSAPTLFFAPTTIGELPMPGDAASWGGLSYSVKDVTPLDLDGRGAIAAYVVIAR